METLSELFYKDPYQKEFTASVVSCTEGKRGYEVVLSDTAFYPEGGGQPADHGTLGEAAVTDVRKSGGQIVHYTDKPLEAGSEVTGKLDWARRFDNMQNHTGEHMLSGLVHAKFKYENVGFHMDDDVITVDFSGPVTEEELAEIERQANEAVAANLPVNVLLPTSEELASIEYRSKKELSGQVRLIDIPGVDRCACCGTHVRTTGEVGLIKCLSLAKHRGGVRIEMVCGARALRDYQKKTEQTAEISKLLSAKPGEIAAAVQKVLDEVLVRDQRIAALNARYFEMKAASLPSGGKFVCTFEEGLSPLEIKKFCNVLVEGKKASVCAVFSPAAGNRGWNYIIASDEVDLKPFAKDLNQKLNGRGGGSSVFIQGTYQAERENIQKLLTETFA